MASLFVDNLTVIDFSYLHPQRGIVGESWIVDIQLEGQLNDEGMVFDFGDVKKQIKQAIDNGVDHKFLLPTELSGLNILEDGEQFRFSFDNGQGLALEYESPREAVYLLDAGEITIANLTPVLTQFLKTVVPVNVTDVRIRLAAEVIPGPYYHYSHGLKKHQGDCQRICHGHRSPLEVYRNGQRDTEIEQEWARRWEDIYLITREDILSEKDGRITLGYEAEQGYFQLTVPKTCCEIIDTDSTVELIAQYLAQEIKASHGDDQIEVKAYEGVKKGALSWA